jgi:hypothetical protein
MFDALSVQRRADNGEKLRNWLLFPGLFHQQPIDLQPSLAAGPQNR